MPELPEVETMCRCIAPAVGCRIRDVERPRSRLQSIAISPRLDYLRRRIVGKRIEAVRRVGKRVVLQLDAAKANDHHRGRENAKSAADRGDCLVLEPRMTGLILLAEPPDPEHVRLIFRLDGSRPKQILFWDRRGLGVARLLSQADFFLRLRPGSAGARCAGDRPRDAPCALGRQPAGGQGRPARPALAGRRGQPLRLGNPAPVGHRSATCAATGCAWPIGPGCSTR